MVEGSITTGFHRTFGRPDSSNKGEFNELRPRFKQRWHAKIKLGSFGRQSFKLELSGILASTDTLLADSIDIGILGQGIIESSYSMNAPTGLGRSHLRYRPVGACPFHQVRNDVFRPFRSHA